MRQKTEAKRQESKNESDIDKVDDWEERKLREEVPEELNTEPPPPQLAFVRDCRAKQSEARRQDEQPPCREAHPHGPRTIAIAASFCHIGTRCVGLTAGGSAARAAKPTESAAAAG